MSPKAMLVTDYIDHLTQRFESAGLSYGHGTDNAGDEAFYLVFAALDLPFESGAEVWQRPLSGSEIEKLDALASQRIIDRIPVAYLVGKAWFAGFCFHVDNRVLIPRSPIAELIQNQFSHLLDAIPHRILELCTGSGCIGIACAMTFPQSRVDLADISAQALVLAQRNLEVYDLQNRVRVISSNLLDNISGRYDLIVCNPPYVSAGEVAALAAEYHHEPVLGLQADDDGLALVMRILSQAESRLSRHGALILEVGFSAATLAARLPQVPFLWLDFEQGGEGVFLLTRSQLRKYRGCFN